jgi:hypothetical protein
MKQIVRMLGTSARTSSLKREISLMTALSLLVISGALSGGPIAHADKKGSGKRQIKPSLSFSYGRIEFTYTKQKPDGQLVKVTGGLHVVSQVSLEDGLATQFDLHANLFDASAVSLDGTQTYRAVGAFSDIFVPASPVLPTDPVPNWTLAFVLRPDPPSPAPIGSPNQDLVFSLTLQTTYDADGSLMSATVLDQGPPVLAGQ